MHDAVTTTSSGVGPQRENDDGDTVIVIMSGLLEKACRVTGETDGLHVKESAALPENGPDALNLIMRGLILQETGKFELFAYAK
ncbi:hypothetical protein AUF62_01570 [archaeon 13_1_20CM_52_20]|nr:MAG: hypothetical protein AUF62_01570 [archaeon 13_1_20CM_52_20]